VEQLGSIRCFGYEDCCELGTSLGIKSKEWMSLAKEWPEEVEVRLWRFQRKMVAR
jgi:hypothetical protein